MSFSSADISIATACVAAGAYLFTTVNPVGATIWALTAGTCGHVAEKFFSSRFECQAYQNLGAAAGFGMGWAGGVALANGLGFELTFKGSLIAGFSALPVIPVAIISALAFTALGTALAGYGVYLGVKSWIDDQ